MMKSSCGKAGLRCDCVSFTSGLVTVDSFTSGFVTADSFTSGFVTAD